MQQPVVGGGGHYGLVRIRPAAGSQRQPAGRSVPAETSTGAGLTGSMALRSLIVFTLQDWCPISLPTQSPTEARHNATMIPSPFNCCLPGTGARTSTGASGDTAEKNTLLLLLLLQLPPWPARLDLGLGRGDIAGRQRARRRLRSRRPSSRWGC